MVPPSAEDLAKAEFHRVMVVSHQRPSGGSGLGSGGGSGFGCGSANPLLGDL
jgi:hypothetical protein